MPASADPGAVYQSISLARGVPSTDLLAVAALADAAREAVLADPGLALGYGAPTGHPALSAWFGELLSVDPERVVLTNGSLQALVFLSNELAGPGDWIAMEQPTYDFSLRQLVSTGARVVGLAVDRDGLDVLALEREIESNGPPAFCYTIPTFQNPTGTTMSTAKRIALVALARTHSFRLIEDDPYGMLRFEGAPPPTLFALDPDRVIHLTSLTKTVAPGLRCGACVLPPELVGRIADVARHTYIAPGHLAQATAAHFVRTAAFPAGIAHTVEQLRLRRDRLLAGLHRLGLACEPPSGGYFAWLKLVDVSATELARTANGFGLEVVPGTRFFMDGGGDDRLRLTWAAARVEAIDEAVLRLGRALDAPRQHAVR